MRCICEVGGFGLAFEEGEEEGGGDGDDEAGLCGDEGAGDARGDGVDGRAVSCGHAGEGDEHSGHGAEESEQGGGGNEDGEKGKAALDPSHFIEFVGGVGALGFAG